MREEDQITRRIREQKEKAATLRISLSSERTNCDPAACGCGVCLGYWTDPVCPILRHMEEDQIRNWAERVRRYLMGQVWQPKKMKRSRACSTTFSGGSHQECKAKKCACPCHLLDLIDWGGG